MKIGFVAERLRGADERMRTLARALASDGHEICMFGISDGSRETAFLAEGYEATWEPLPVGFSKTWTLEFLRRTYMSPESPWLPVLRRWIAGVKPDFLHVNDLPLSWVVSEVAREFSIPVVVDYHHEGWPEMARALSEIRGPSVPWWTERDTVFRFWEDLEQACFDRVDRILVVDDVLNPVFTSRGCPPEKLVLVRNTPQTDRLLRPNGRREFQPLTFDLGYIGSFDVMKDIPGLLRAFAEVPKAVASRLLLVGAGEQGSAARSLISDLRLEERVAFLGWQPKERFGELIEACKVCLIPLRLNDFTHQTSPNKIFEYMYFGRPVLCTPARHLVSLLNRTGAGRVCSLQDGLFGEVTAHLGGADQALEMGRRGRDAVSTSFRWEDDVHRLGEAFH